MNQLTKYRASWLRPLEDFFNNDDVMGTRWLNRNFNQPAVNISESENEYNIELAVPGYRKEDFKIRMDDDLLIVSAESKAENKEDKKEYTRREYSYHSFSRSFSLPENIKDDGIVAKYEDGMLRLQVPKTKASEAKPKREITVS